MVDLKVVEGEKSEIPDQEKLARLVYEMKRSALVWNHFAGSLIDGWYPARLGALGGDFKGSDRERIEQLFKIRDHETRHVFKVLRELGINEESIDYGPIYYELVNATEITSSSHKSL